MKAFRLPNFILLLSGIGITALTLVFPNVGFLEWLSMIPVFLGIFRLFDQNENLSKKKIFRIGFLTVYFYYFILYHWFLSMYPLDFAGLGKLDSVGVVLAGWLVLPLFAALPGGVTFLITFFAFRTKFVRKYKVFRPIVFSVLWILLEWFTTLGFWGVPWGRLALGQIRYLPILQSAALFGSYFVGFLILTVNGFLAFGLYESKKRTVSFLTAGAIFAGNLLYGILAMRVPVTASGEAVTVVGTQGNISSTEKWGIESNRITKERYLSMIEEAAQKGADLIVLPETAFPYDVTLRAEIKNALTNAAKDYAVTILVGSFCEDGEEEYNVLYHITPEGDVGREYYAKRHLVPFGEYVPARDLVAFVFPPLSDLSVLDSELTPGKDSGVLDTQVGKIGSLICFDSIYETLAIDSVRDGAEILVVSSNDSWFSDSAAVYQHEAQSVLRAIECGRYLVRSANTGISSVISPKGEHLDWEDPLVEGYVIAEVVPIQTKTLYLIIGNGMIYLFLCGVLLLFVFDLFAKKKKRFWRKRKWLKLRF